MPTTIDPTDPRLSHGIDSAPTGQAKAYLILSKAERAKGFVRPLRTTYRHAGTRPVESTRDLTPDEQAMFSDCGYVAFEPYDRDEPGRGSAIGRFWTREQLESGCGAVTTMDREIAETYARNPKFYGATYCVQCQRHLPVAEFRWVDDDQVVGS